MQKKGTSRLKTIGYWAATALVAFELLVGGTADLVHGPILLFAGDPAVQVMEQLGYPVYLLHIVGVWKLLGAVALLLPRFPRLKEWAYAGSFIALTGAAVHRRRRGRRCRASCFRRSHSRFVDASAAKPHPRGPFPKRGGSGGKCMIGRAIALEP